MPQSARLVALLLCALGIIYVAYTAFDAAMTEKLDADTIKNIYKQGDTFIKNAQGMQIFLQKRLHESYKRTGSVINSVKDKPDQTTPLSLNKTQAIDMMTEELKLMTISKYDHKVLDVQFTPDNQYAYVSSTEVATGTINMPLPGGKSINLPFNEASACIDTLMVANKAVVIVRTECTNKMAFLQ